MSAHQKFIRTLKQALAAVERGDTGCATAPDKCWKCAMRYRAGKLGEEGGYFLSGWTGPLPAADWSLKRPKSDTIALFRNSIAALEQQ